MMPKSVLGGLFLIGFLPVFIALMVMGERKEGEGMVWYVFKKFMVAVLVGLTWLGGVSYYMISNGI